ncbi:MAG: hypothetical protein GXO16_05860 [Epsilonproteobacteria bacterium]|nr:hypothetical protein [Campylobacterota bacterium]
MYEYRIDDEIRAKEALRLVQRHPNLATVAFETKDGDYKNTVTGDRFSLSAGEHTVESSMNDLLLYALDRLNRALPPQERFGEFKSTETFMDHLPEGAKKDLEAIANEIIHQDDDNVKVAYKRDFASMMEGFSAEAADKRGVRYFKNDGVQNINYKLAKADSDITDDELKRFMVNAQKETFFARREYKKELSNPVLAKLDELSKKIDDPKTEEEIKQYYRQFAQFHQYSYFNTMMVEMEAQRRGTTVSLLRSFDDWTKMENEQGEKVKINKGEKGYKIFVPTPKIVYQRDKNGELILDKEGKPVPERDEKGEIIKVMHFKIGTVFDVSQTNAIEIGAIKMLDYREKSAAVDEALLNKLADAIRENFGVEVEFREIKGLAKGRYSVEDRKIVVDNKPERTPAEKLSTLFHELGHHIIHGKDLAQKHLDYKDIHANRGEKEAQAESFSYVMSYQFGVENKSELYIKSWGATRKDLEQMFKTVTAAVRYAYKVVDFDKMLEDHIKEKEHQSETTAIDYIRQKTKENIETFQKVWEKVVDEVEAGRSWSEAVREAAKLGTKDAAYTAAALEILSRNGDVGLSDAEINSMTETAARKIVKSMPEDVLKGVRAELRDGDNNKTARKQR